MYISPVTIITRILLALLCGSLLGLEREWRERSAGLRTHSLVSISACLIMIISSFGFADVLPVDHVGLDPSRVAAQVVSSIGFLGAGVIIFRKNSVRGLTTAASIWASAGVGMAAGGGLYWLTVVGTASILFVQTCFRKLEVRFFLHHQQMLLKLRIAPGESSFTEIARLFEATGMSVRKGHLTKGKNGKLDQVDIMLGRVNAKARSAAFDQLHTLKGFLGMKFQIH